MSVTFDPVNKRIIVDTGVTSVSALDIYSRWKDWVVTNPQYLPVFRVVGGDPIGSGLFVSSYFFLMNGWRIRPYEGNHTLIVNGNLFVDGGGVPLVSTLGNFNVSVQYTVPVQAQTVSTAGGASGPTAAEIAAAVKALLTQAPSVAMEQTVQNLSTTLSTAIAGVNTNVDALEPEIEKARKAAALAAALSA